MNDLQAIRARLASVSIDPILALLGEYVDVGELFHISEIYDGYRPGGCIVHSLRAGFNQSVGVTRRLSVLPGHDELRIRVEGIKRPSDPVARRDREATRME